MTQTTNTQIDRIIKRTDEITEKELARQELPNPRTQTNTTQNKEELERAIKKCARESSDGIFVYRYIKNYYEKAISQAHQSGIEEGARAERVKIAKLLGDEYENMENNASFYLKLAESLKENNEKASK